jgi:hypothetical protein
VTALAAFLIGSSAGGGALSATKDGDAFAEGFAPPNTQFLTTNDVTVTATGGVATATHSWAFVSGNNVFTISGATDATVNWSANIGLASRSAVWRDTVTDGVSFVTVDVNVFAQVV